jgi:hypothetical protein
VTKIEASSAYVVRWPIDQATVASSPGGGTGDEHERPGPIRVLRRPRIQARLTVEGSLLVAGDAADRDAVEPGQGVAARASQLADRRPDLRQRRARDAEQVQQLVVPVAGAQVVEHRARGVRGLGDVLAGELERQPGVDRAEHRPARAGTLGEAVDLLQQPLDLRRREVRVEDQPGGRTDQRLVAAFPQLVAARRGATVLPDQRTVQRLAGGRIPDADRLALVRDPDRVQLARGGAGLGERLERDRPRHLPDLARVVLDLPGAREVLFELAVGAPEQLGLEVEHQARDAGGSLVDRQDHRGRSLRTSTSGRIAAAQVPTRCRWEIQVPRPKMPST